MIFPCVRRANTKNTNTKYTNTAYDELPERPNKWYIFEKRIIKEYQKLCCSTTHKEIVGCSNTVNASLSVNYHQCISISASASFSISLNNPLFKNIPLVLSFWHFVICCICVVCICVFGTWNYNF